MKFQTLIISFFCVLLFTQCKKSVEPYGYYYVINENYKPAHIFYYNNGLHLSHYFFDEEITTDWLDSITNVFREKKKVFAFHDDENTNVDTLRFTNVYQSTNVLQYYFVYTQASCKFYVKVPSQLVGTYEFIPTRAEEELISFAVSQLDFGDTMPEFNSFKKQPDNVVIEDAYFSLLVKSNRLNIDLVAHLYADEVPDEVFFLSDALDAIVYDHCNPIYLTKDKLDKTVMETFERKINEKYIPPLPFFED